MATQRILAQGLRCRLPDNDDALVKRQVLRFAAWGAAAALACKLGGIAQADPLLPSLPQDFFPIGVFYQPAQAFGTTNFAGWRARGVNTLGGWEQQAGSPAPATIDDYTTAAVNADRYLIRHAWADP